jgi:hypothetical protein
VGNLPYGSNTILFSAGFSGTAYTEYWKIWIDYNQNGTFETSEEIVTGSSSSSANLTSTLRYHLSFSRYYSYESVDEIQCGANCL